jgi:hypothetical protein
VGAREKDGERGEEVWGIIEAVNDIVFGGGDGCRAHVWWTVMMLWEKKGREDVVNEARKESAGRRVYISD